MGFSGRGIRLIFACAALSAVMAAAFSAPAFAAEGASYTVREDHPRIWITADDEFASVGKLRGWVRSGANSRLPDGAPGAALRWLLLGEARSAEAAIRALADADLSGADNLRIAALTYDWVANYPDFPEDYRKHITSRLVAEAAKHLGAIEGCYLISNGQGPATAAGVAALAVYHEEPAAKKIVDAAHAKFSQLLKFGEILSGGDWPESIDYQHHAMRWFIHWAEAWRTATGDTSYLENPMFRNCGDVHLYKIKPDGHFSNEDDNDHPQPLWHDRVMEAYCVARNRDGHVKWFYNHLNKDGVMAAKIENWLWMDPDVPEKPLTSLPTNHIFPGTGVVIMKDGWGPNSRWINFRCGDYWTKHNHFDQNSFMIYYKGDLAIHAGYYCGNDDDHYRNFWRRAISKNTMLIWWPDEKFIYADDPVEVNDGGQYMGVPDGFPGRRQPDERPYWYWNAVRDWSVYQERKTSYDTGDITAYEDGGNVYCYVRGDATKAYNSAKIRHFTRQMFYLKPQVLLIYDRVGSKKPEGMDRFAEKIWMLRTMERPLVSGDIVASDDVSETFNGDEVLVGHLKGRMQIKVLSPEAPRITRRGGPGNEFWVPTGADWSEGRNAAYVEARYEGATPGKYSLEVRNSEETADDVFFMLVNITEDGRDDFPEYAVISSDEISGVLLDSKSVVVFAREEKALESATFDIDASGKVTFYLCDLAPGRDYSVMVNGVTRAEVTATDGGFATFEAEIDGPSKVEIR